MVPHTLFFYFKFYTNLKLRYMFKIFYRRAHCMCRVCICRYDTQEQIGFCQNSGDPFLLTATLSGTESGLLKIPQFANIYSNWIQEYSKNHSFEGNFYRKAGKVYNGRLYIAFHVLREGAKIIQSLVFSDNFQSFTILRFHWAVKPL